MALLVHRQRAALEHAAAASTVFCAGSRGWKRRSTALTRSTSRRCENGFLMKSSAPIFRPNSSSISSSFEVRKMTGRSVFWRRRRKQLHAVHARHLDVEDGEVRRVALEAVESGGAVGIGLHPIALGLQRDRNRGKNIAIVVDQGDRRHLAYLRLRRPPVQRPAKLAEHRLCRVYARKMWRRLLAEIRRGRLRDARAAAAVPSRQPVMDHSRRMIKPCSQSRMLRL